MHRIWIFLFSFLMPGVVFSADDPNSCRSLLIKQAPSVITAIASAADCALSAISVANFPIVNWTFTASGAASCISFASRAFIIQSYLKIFQEKRGIGGRSDADDLKDLYEKNLHFNSKRTFCLFCSYIDLAALVVGCGESWQRYTDIISCIASGFVCVLAIYFWYDIACSAGGSDASDQIQLSDGTLLSDRNLSNLPVQLQFSESDHLDRPRSVILSSSLSTTSTPPIASSPCYG